MNHPLRSVFPQVLALLLICVAITVASGLGVIAFSPTPPPPTVSIATFLHAYKTGADEEISIRESDSPPRFWYEKRGQAEILIGKGLADALGVEPTNVKVEITAPALYGLPTNAGAADRGQITIIDVPTSLQFAPSGQRFNINRFLQDEEVRVPPFVAVVKLDSGRYLELRPRERFPTPWQFRLLVIFFASILATAPLAWYAAYRWTRPIRLLAARIDQFDGDDPGPSVTTANDASEVSALERAIESLHERLQSQISERLRMLMAVAHDLRTPLTSLRIRSEEAAEPVRAGLVKDIARLDQMIEGILAFAHLHGPPQDREIFDCAQLTSDLVAEAIALGGEVEFVGEEVWVEGNRSDIARAIENVLSNARRYGGRTGVTLYRRNEEAVLRIVDNGPGVPEDLIPRLTEPFYRMEGSRSSDTGGVGLGLATVNAIIHAHEGSLTFENVSEGFAVEMRFPAAPTAP
jgi:signal transduction histidine kinase